MISLLLATALAAEPSDLAVPAAEAPAETPKPAKKSWFSQIRYGIGFSSHMGGGTDGTVFGKNLVVEPFAFELRSFLAPRFAFHTTLNLARMIAPAVESKDGRIDYGCHVGGHVPVGKNLAFVVAPGADIAYSFTKSRYQRIVGDVRLGVDVEHGAWTTSFYVRPYGGWYREVGQEVGRPVGGAMFEVANIWLAPKKGKKARKG